MASESSNKKKARQPFVADLSSGAINPNKFSEILNKLTNRSSATEPESQSTIHEIGSLGSKSTTVIDQSGHSSDSSKTSMVIDHTGPRSDLTLTSDAEVPELLTKGIVSERSLNSHNTQVKEQKNQIDESETHLTKENGNQNLEQPKYEETSNKNDDSPQRSMTNLVYDQNSLRPDLSMTNEVIDQNNHRPLVIDQTGHRPERAKINKKEKFSDHRPEQSMTNTAHQYGFRVTNYLFDELLPTLQPMEQIVLLRLYRLSFGFNRNITDSVSISKLAEKCNIGTSTLKRSLQTLQQLGLIKVLSDNSKSKFGGNKYFVFPNQEKVIDQAGPRPQRSMTSMDHIKDHDHEDLKIKDLHDQSAHERETMTIYQSITGNKWGKADRAAYKQIEAVPIERIAQTIRDVMARAPQKPGSLAYFVKEILNPSPINTAAKSNNRSRLKAIVERISQANVGRQYSIGDLADDTKLACARDGVAFDNDLFNEIIASRSR